MAESWSPIDLTNVAAGGALTQLFPEHVTPGEGAIGLGKATRWIRQAVEGVLTRVEVYPKSAGGGVLELWDIAGSHVGGTNNVNTGTALTDAFLTTAKAENNARLLWSIEFKGDAGLGTKVMATRVPFVRGLAARFTSGAAAAGSESLSLNILAEGGYRKVEMAS